MIKCDKAMRRSKERGFTPLYTRWKCNGMCEGCICALHKRHDGTWEHTQFKAGHSHGKGETNV